MLAAHAELCHEEQMALTIATEGRVKGVGRKWNLVPHWNNLADGPEGPERSLFGTAGEAAKWKNGVPEGIIHWTVERVHEERERLINVSLTEMTRRVAAFYSQTADVQSLLAR